MTELHDLHIKDKVTDEYARVEANGGLAVNLQDQHTRALDLKFIRALSTPAEILNGAIAIDSTTWLLDNTTDAVVGRTILVVNVDGTFNIAQVLIVNAGVSVVVDTPADTAMVEAGSIVIYATSDMAVAGGALGSPLIYQIAGVGATTGIDIDVTRILGSITDGSAMDDGMFGSIAGGLTNGIVLRHNNGTAVNLWNVKTNGDLGLLCFDASYSEKGGGGGTYGFRFRNTYAGTSKHGVTIRLEASDTLEVLIQDDLSDLATFEMMAQGHLVSDV